MKQLLIVRNPFREYFYYRSVLRQGRLVVGLHGT